MERPEKPLVAVCLLTVGDIHPFLKKTFETTAFQEHFRLFIHPKFENQLSIDLREKCIPRNLRVNTKWGHVSLVDAELSLISYAFQNPDIDYFLLLSENHIPLLPWDKIWEQIKVEWTLKKGRMNLHQASGERWASLQKPPIVPFNMFYKHSQWISFTREVADFFIKTGNLHIKKFKKMLAPDEHYFICVLLCHGANPSELFFQRPTTYVEFPIGSGHAKTFNTISPNYIQKLIMKRYWFFRKASYNCLFPVDFLNKFFPEISVQSCEQSKKTDEEHVEELGEDDNKLMVIEAPPVFGGT